MRSAQTSVWWTRSHGCSELLDARIDPGDVCLHVMDEGQGMGKGVGEMGRALIARASAGQARCGQVGRHTHTVVHVCSRTSVHARACNACVHGWDEGETGEAVGGTGQGDGEDGQECGHASVHSCVTRGKAR